MSDIDQSIVELVVENKDKDDNTILGLIIQTGSVPFNKAKGVLAKVLEEQGLRMSKAQRDEKAQELMEDFSVSEETTTDEVTEQIESLMDELDCSVGIARGYVRAAFEAEELTMPKVARKTSGPRTSTPGFNGDAKLVSDFLISNKDCTREEFDTFMKDQGKATTKTGADKTGRWWNVLVDLKVFAESYCAE